MEIRDERIHDLEFVPRIDKDRGIVAARVNNAVIGGSTLDGAAAGRADADDSFAVPVCFIDEVGRLRRDLIPLCVHVMLAHIIDLDRTESPEADMQCHIGKIYALRADFVEQFLCEMKSCRRCRRGAVKFRIDGIVHLRILELVRDVRRERHLAETVENLLENSIIMEFYNPVAVVDDIHNFRRERAVSKGHFCARAKLLAGTHQCLPLIAGTALQEQYFHVRSCICFRPQESCRDDLRVVENEGLAGLQIIDDVAEDPVFQLSCLPVDTHKPRGRTVLQRILCNQLLRKVIVIILRGVTDRNFFFF